MIESYSTTTVLIFSFGVITALILDLYAHKHDRAISFGSALFWSSFWVLLGVLFGVYVGISHGIEQSSLYFAGYLLEKSLSVDNLFVFMAIFTSFGIGDRFQHRILYFGIIGALVFRFVFIALGSSALMVFGKWALLVFAVFVLWSAWKMWQATRQQEKEVVDYTGHWSVKLTQRFLPVHPFRDGHAFFTRKDGRVYCTPFFLCLVVIEIADIMFAFDSVPAVIAITREPFLIYTSNIFAILGLRSLYFLLVAAKRSFCHLECAVILVLVFIGIKMLLDIFEIVHLTPNISLVIVMTLLLGGVVCSFLFPVSESIDK